MAFFRDLPPLVVKRIGKVSQELKNHLKARKIAVERKAKSKTALNLIREVKGNGFDAVQSFDETFRDLDEFIADEVTVGRNEARGIRGGWAKLSDTASLQNTVRTYASKTDELISKVNKRIDKLTDCLAGLAVINAAGNMDDFFTKSASEVPLEPVVASAE
ncbi:MAG: hypothetical protein LBP36_01130 [Oscillospiraceae bacterium]|jgi:hypothetical protein|nr:hypothetical protein [Oscillospiraceae bacterium]